MPQRLPSTSANRWPRCSASLGGVLSPPLLSTFLATYRWAYAEQDARLTQPYPGVVATLEALSTFTLGIVTTKEPGRRRWSYVGWPSPLSSGIFKAVALMCLSNPRPDMVLAALAALRCAPPQTLMVGDTPADILAGKAAGTATCAVTYGFGSREALLQCAPDCVIGTFGELATLMGG